MITKRLKSTFYEYKTVLVDLSSGLTDLTTSSVKPTVKRVTEKNDVKKID